MKTSHMSKESQEGIQHIQTKQFNFIKLKTEKKTKNMQQNNIIIAKVSKQKFKTNIAKTAMDITNQPQAN